MRTSIAIMAAAAIGIGSAAFTTSPASAQTAEGVVPLVHEGATTANIAAEQVQYRRGYRHSRGWHPRRHAHRYHHPRRHHHRRDRGAAAAGIIGFGAGALLGQALTAPRTQTYAYAGRGPAHVQWCQQRFRSYDVRTDTYLSYDGNRYRCNSPY